LCPEAEVRFFEEEEESLVKARERFEQRLPDHHGGADE